MTALTIQTVMAIALSCQPPTAHPDELARVLTGIALQESRLDPSATHRNYNGTTDAGIMQVNSIHLGRPIGYHGHVITAQSLLDPCESIAAGGAILLAGLSTFNTGSPTRGMNYASRAVAAISQVMDRPTDHTTAPADALAEPVKTRQGAKAILVFDGWEGE